jgi:hypothetical protein
MQSKEKVMTKDEALDKALDALIHKANMIPVMQGNCYVIHPEAMQAVIDEAIKQARSAPVQEPEPACWQDEDSCPNRQACCDAQQCLYTTPPAAQRQWVGLTVQLAREAGIDAWWDSGSDWRETFNEHLKAFEALVRADEREACAKVCEELLMWNEDDPGSSAAKAIRARGNT